MVRRFRGIFLVLVVSCSFSAWSETIERTGWISDPKCGAKMTGYCARACITAGEKPVFVGEDKQVVPIANPELTKGFAGERVIVKGSVSEGKPTIGSINRASSR